MSTTRKCSSCVPSEDGVGVIAHNNILLFYFSCIAACGVWRAPGLTAIGMGFYKFIYSGYCLEDKYIFHLFLAYFVGDSVKSTMPGLGSLERQIHRALWF